PRDPRLLATVEFILRHCTVRGGFFQDVIHSGINAYLTLHLAQVLLRAGDPRHFDLIETVADLATPTGQWPEAIHPRTLGGCMGDGQHAWASAEWVLMMRNLFVREEDGGLVLGSGLPQRWLVRDATMRIGPVHTAYGPVSVEVACTGRPVLVRWEADRPNAAPHIEVRIPGLEPIVPSTGQQSVALEVPARSHAAEFGS